jgi:hypothetical protein
MLSCAVGIIYIITFAVYVLPIPSGLGDFGYNYFWRLMEVILLFLLLATLKIPQKTTDEFSTKVAAHHFSGKDTVGPNDYQLPEVYLHNKGSMVDLQNL